MELEFTDKYIKYQGIKRRVENPFVFDITFGMEIPKWAKLLQITNQQGKTRVIFEIAPRRFSIEYRSKYSGSGSKFSEISLPWQYMVYDSDFPKDPYNYPKLFFSATKAVNLADHLVCNNSLIPNVGHDGTICVGDILNRDVSAENKKHPLDMATILIDRFYDSRFNEGMGGWEGKAVPRQLLEEKSPEEVCEAIKPFCVARMQSLLKASPQEKYLINWLNNQPVMADLVEGTTKAAAVKEKVI